MRKFKTESQRILDLMINSVYKNREIFLRELISNASDAIDKMYYKSLTDSTLVFNKDDYYIRVEPNKEKRTLTLIDTGIGMTKDELNDHLGVIAKSGSYQFKNEEKIEEDHEIIGQFGVGFYSAFLVAQQVEVISRAHGEDSAHKWTSKGAEGYKITDVTDEVPVGTTIILTLKDNTDDDNYDEFLETHTLRRIIKKYSDFIRYPIKLDVTRSQLKEGSEDEYEEVVEEETVNSMIPIWKKNKRELSDEDYKTFYRDKRFGFDDPTLHAHISVDGNVSYNAVLFVPGQTPFDFYTPDYKKGLELYSSGVLIMDKCEDLLPDYFNFVKGVVDSEDVSLNISREVLQDDRQLKLIAKNLQRKIKGELEDLLKKDFDKYVTFFEQFGRTLKFGVYADFGQNKDVLQDLIIFESSYEDKFTTLKDYALRMQPDQDAIYYATGESKERIKNLPQIEAILEAGIEVLYLTDDVDEFAIKMLMNYDEKPFKPVSEYKVEANKEADEKANEEFKDIFETLQTHLSDEVKAVRASSRLKSHPVALTHEGEISIEMEKVMAQQPGGGQMKAEKVLEINTEHEVFGVLQNADEDTQKKMVDVLYNQARLIEGLSVEDPAKFAQDVASLLARNGKER